MINILIDIVIPHKIMESWVWSRIYSHFYIKKNWSGLKPHPPPGTRTSYRLVRWINTWFPSPGSSRCNSDHSQSFKLNFTVFICLMASCNFKIQWYQLPQHKTCALFYQLLNPIFIHFYLFILFIVQIPSSQFIDMNWNVPLIFDITNDCHHIIAPL